MKELLPFMIASAMMLCCLGCENKKNDFTGAANEVKLLTLDPGHFHAALVQKTMYDQVNPVVHVYAPDGADVKDHLDRINGFNARQNSPTNWDERQIGRAHV